MYPTSVSVAEQQAVLPPVIQSMVLLPVVRGAGTMSAECATTSINGGAISWLVVLSLIKHIKMIRPVKKKSFVSHLHLHLFQGFRKKGCVWHLAGKRRKHLSKLIGSVLKLHLNLYYTVT